MANEAPFVVERPDGFVGVEVHVDEQLTVEEVLELAAKLLSVAAGAQRVINHKRTGRES